MCNIQNLHMKNILDFSVPFAILQKMMDSFYTYKFKNIIEKAL